MRKSTRQPNNTTQEIATCLKQARTIISGTEYRYSDRVYRHRRGGKFSYEVVKNLCNGTAEVSKTFPNKSEAMSFFYNGSEAAKDEKGVKIYYAVKETWGSLPIEVVASGTTIAQAEEAAKQALQTEHGGLWVGEFRNCFIGSERWLKKQFGSDSYYVTAAIENYSERR